MNEVDPVQVQDGGFRRWGRYIAGVAVGAVLYFAGKELTGLSEPLDVLAGALGGLASNAAIGKYQIWQSQEYPPHRSLDI